MKVNDNGGNNQRSSISELFKKVLTDPEFKELLQNDPDKAMEDYDLSEPQKIMIKNLDEEDYKKLSQENLEEFFAADAAVYTPDEMSADDEEAYSLEDFDSIEDDIENDEF